MVRKTIHILYIVLFTGILLTPAALWLAGVKDPQPFTENRRKTKLPVLDIGHLDPYPVKLDSFFNDTFPYRNSIIFQLNYINSRYLKKSPVPDKVLIGKADWLYSVDESFDFYTGKKRFTPEELKQIGAEINDRGAKCRAMGAEYRIVIIPSKYRIYPEYLPDYLQQQKTSNPVSEFVQYIQQNTSVKVLYLLDNLQSAKKEGVIFRKGDTHWNDRGTYFGYRGIVNWMKPDYSWMQPEPRNDFDFKDTLSHTGDLIGQFGLNAVWPSPDVLLKPKKKSRVALRIKENYPCDEDWFAYCYCYEEARINKADTTLPGLLVFRDSYTNDRMMTLLSGQFGRSTFIWDYWQHKLNPEIIRKEKPRVVLCIMPERFLDDFLKYPNRLEKSGVNRMEPANKK